MIHQTPNQLLYLKVKICSLLSVGRAGYNLGENLQKFEHVYFRCGFHRNNQLIQLFHISGLILLQIGGRESRLYISSFCYCNFVVCTIEHALVLRSNSGLNRLIEVRLWEGAALGNKDMMESLKRGNGNVVRTNSDHRSVFFVKLVNGIEPITLM